MDAYDTTLITFLTPEVKGCQSTLARNPAETSDRIPNELFKIKKLDGKKGSKIQIHLTEAKMF